VAAEGDAVTLAVHQLSCGYGRRAVLKGVSVTLNRGELTTVLGPNGCGKTTLLKTLARLLPPLGGAVTLDGQPLADLARRHVARNVAFAPQVLAPDWPFTVSEYVALGRSPHAGWWKPLTVADRSAIAASIARFSLTPLANARVTELSGGEWQRVRLAKVIAQEPQVLLLDEPTAHLDPRFQFELLTLVRELIAERNLTVAVTLHDLNLVGPWADRVILLANGGVIADGSPADVLTADRLADAYSARFAVAPHPTTGTPAVTIPR
jgi:iron complex transport system ATP-binding protein